jgi:prepilin-type processing-associated H-X9-DG protein
MKHIDSAEAFICPSSEDFFVIPNDAAINNPKTFQWAKPEGTGAPPPLPVLDRGHDPELRDNQELSDTCMRQQRQASSVRADTMLSAGKALRSLPDIADVNGTAHESAAGNHTGGYNVLFADGRAAFVGRAKKSIIKRLEARLQLLDQRPAAAK